MDQKPQAILYQVRKWGYFMRVLRGLRWEFSPLLITRVISTSRCSSVLSSRLLESVPDPNLSSWIFNWCYANNTPNLYTELFKAPYKPTVPENETWISIKIWARANRKILQSLKFISNSDFIDLKVKSCGEYLIQGSDFVLSTSWNSS